MDVVSGLLRNALRLGSDSSKDNKKPPPAGPPAAPLLAVTTPTPPALRGGVGAALQRVASNAAKSGGKSGVDECRKKCAQLEKTVRDGLETLRKMKSGPARNALNNEVMANMKDLKAMKQMMASYQTAKSSVDRVVFVTTLQKEKNSMIKETLETNGLSTEALEDVKEESETLRSLFDDIDLLGMEMVRDSVAESERDAHDSGAGIDVTKDALDAAIEEGWLDADDVESDMRDRFGLEAQPPERTFGGGGGVGVGAPPVDTDVALRRGDVMEAESARLSSGGSSGSASGSEGWGRVSSRSSVGSKQKKTGKLERLLEAANA